MCLKEVNRDTVAYGAGKRPVFKYSKRKSGELFLQAGENVDRAALILLSCLRYNVKDCVAIFVGVSDMGTQQNLWQRYFHPDHSRYICTEEAIRVIFEVSFSNALLQRIRRRIESLVRDNPVGEL
ncbi:hypothetical protein EVAR_11646_1 [Eumeta japonica]|uniref:Uncharacterized protein n=1 Tax=Eumeta variegata TaxID=151549 RepID=A0A4C1WVF9_EUMVA|nr:hypothetical protein EVAR_11646_1 [Eumeta japonica]